MALKRMAIIAVAGLFTAAGCQSAAMDQERTLAAAGFQMKQANTPRQQATIANLPQRKLTPVSRNGETMYVYPDAKYCNCIYVGSQEAYGRYQNLAIKQRIAEEQAMASMNWGVWGAWGPWW